MVAIKFNEMQIVKNILGNVGFGWSKWRTITRDKPMIKETYNPMLGFSFGPVKVVVDVQQKKNSLTGKIKYRNVEK